MNPQRKAIVAALIVCLSLIGGVVLTSSVTTARPDPRQGSSPSPQTPRWGVHAGQAAGDASEPVSVEKDEDGYTIWTYDYRSGADPYFCVPFSRLRTPFNIGAQDPTELSDTTIRLTFAEMMYVYNPDVAMDPTWSVALNGDPGPWSADAGFTGNWNIVGAIGTTPQRRFSEDRVFVTQPVTFSHTMIVDGENNLWLQQHDFCNCPSLPDCACTCWDLAQIQFRAAVELAIREISPADGAERVPVNQDVDSQIRVKFSTLPKEESVNEETFVVYTYDPDAYRVYVDGAITRISEVEYAFTPSAPLLDGVKYVVQLYGEEEALADNRDQWVTDLAGGPLEMGKRWTFTTMPDLQVTVKPVQVLEGTNLIHYKPTVLRTFVRWDKHPNVHPRSQVKTVEIDDVIVGWSPPDSDYGESHWRDGGDWLPTWSAKTAQHKREYLTFTTRDESYTIVEKRRLLDSFNYFGFRPQETGTYGFIARVVVKDHLGVEHYTPGLASAVVEAENDLPVYMRAVAVGSDFGKTGTGDLSALVGHQLRAVKAVYPVPWVNRPPDASRMRWFTPAPSSFFCDLDYSTGPWRPYYRKVTCLLYEMNKLCARTTGCWTMVGVTDRDWLPSLGLTDRDAAPLAALIGDREDEAYRYVTAHEIGHLTGIDDHYEGPADDGFNVGRRAIKGAENADVDFMTWNPVVGSTTLWLTHERYQGLRQWVDGHYETTLSTSEAAYPAQDAGPVMPTSSDPLLLVSGAITLTTDEVTLMPWYEMEAGSYVPPTSGPYRLVFLNASDQEISGYTQAFTVGTTLRESGQTLTTTKDTLAFFTFAAPYPAATAKIQIRRTGSGGDAVLKEIMPAASAPTISIDPPASTTWSGAQPIMWRSDPGTRYFAIDVSTDNGTTWESLAVDRTDTAYTVETSSLPDTTQALIRVAATDGLRTSTDTAGPFTIDNPPSVGFLSPSDGETQVGVHAQVEAGFRDAMDPASLDASTFTLTGGPFGSVDGTVSYDAEAREATFTPNAPLVYETTYTARLTTGVEDATGEPLPVDATWTFTTEADVAPPTPLALSPRDGAVNVPLNAGLAVGWDRVLNAGTLDATTFKLATAQGAAVGGAVSYDAATGTATFTPASDLAPDTLYVATLTTGIESDAGHAAEGDFTWAFTTGRDVRSGPFFTGGFADEGTDTDGDGLFDTLVVRVGVHVTATGRYHLSGSLVDGEGVAIGWVTTAADLTPGAHFLDLTFDGAAIGGHGVDGPYALRNLTLVLKDTVNQVPLASVHAREAYRTSAYPVSAFPAPLRFAGLPDVVVKPEISSVNAFNVRDYAQHVTLPSDVLTYTVVFNADSRAGVTLQSTGEIHVTPKPYWLGSTEVTLRVSDGTHAAQDSFTVLVGWPRSLYLPLVLRRGTGATTATRSAWITPWTVDFEGASFPWSRYSWYDWGQIGEGHQWFWGKRDCRVYAGQHSAWAFGGGDDGEITPCGAAYPNTLGSTMYRWEPVDLSHVGKGEYRMKVWTDLAAGDELCAGVARATYGTCEGLSYTSLCRSGTTHGWEDLAIDLANVPGLGSVLGEEDVCFGVTFQADGSGSRAEGAYVDDISLRLCPEGLEGYCAPSSAVAVDVPQEPAEALVAGSIGGYAEEVGEVALAVEAGGRIHVLWTGKLNSMFEDYTFYSTSTDGVNWTPYQVLDRWQSAGPTIAVDDVHHRVHLVTSQMYDGLVHWRATQGAVGDPIVVVPRRTTYAPGLSLPSGGLTSPDITVAEASGDAHLVWQEGYYQLTDGVSYPYLHRSWYASWDGAGWSERQQEINDLDTAGTSIAATPDGRLMMVWFQGWHQSAGDGMGPGAPSVPRTAFGEAPGRFPLRQAAHGLYREPERDESIRLVYAAGEDAFVLVTDHFMWPTHARVYRYLWKNGAWSEPVNVAENLADVASPVYVGAAANSPLIRYVYADNDVLTMRTETGGVLGPEQTVSSYLSARGYGGIPYAYFTDKSGGLHMVAGEKGGVAGLYYVGP